jgi:tRNA threonylcarbamoyladenosine biosynthesis protein TsaE
MFGRSCDISRTFTTSYVGATASLGQQIGEIALPGTLLLLSGELGSGKTAFTQGVARGLGITTVVNSPTFTLLKEYHGGRLDLFHFDLYRLSEIDEIWDLGFADYFNSSGICVIEWAERAVDIWGDAWLGIEFTVVGPSIRQLTCYASGNTASYLMQQLQEP